MRALGGLAALGLTLAGCGSTAMPRTAAIRDQRAVVPLDAAGVAGRPAVRGGAQPWPGFGRDATHSGSAPVVGPQRGHVRWRRRLEGPVVPGPVIGSGRVVLAASNAGVLHAIDLTTGRDRWRANGGGAYGSDLSTSPALLTDGTILWPGPRDAVIALDQHGRERWRLSFDGTPLSPVLAPDGMLIVGDARGGLSAFDPPTSGVAPRRRWHIDLGEVSYGSPAIARDGTVYTTADAGLVAVRDGRVRWRVHARDLSETSPAIAPDGTVVFTANDHTAYGVRPDGRVRWRFDIGALTYSSPSATADGLVYLGDHLGRVTAIDARTGRLRARVRGLSRTPALRSVGVWTQPVIDARHDVYFGTRPGHVYGFDARGRRLLDIDTGATVDSYPALASDGTLVVGSESGDLLAVR